MSKISILDLEQILDGTDVILETISYDDKESYFSYQLKIEKTEEGMVLTFGRLESIIKGEKESGFVQSCYKNNEFDKFIEEENENNFLNELVEENQLDITLLSNIKEYAKLMRCAAI